MNPTSKTFSFKPQPRVFPQVQEFSESLKTRISELAEKVEPLLIEPEGDLIDLRDMFENLPPFGEEVQEGTVGTIEKGTFEVITLDPGITEPGITEPGITENGGLIDLADLITMSERSEISQLVMQYLVADMEFGNSAHGITDMNFEWVGEELKTREIRDIFRSLEEKLSQFYAAPMSLQESRRLYERVLNRGKIHGYKQRGTHIITQVRFEDGFVIDLDMENPVMDLVHLYLVARLRYEPNLHPFIRRGVYTAGEMNDVPAPV